MKNIYHVVKRLWNTPTRWVWYHDLTGIRREFVDLNRVSCGEVRAVVFRIFLLSTAFSYQISLFLLPSKYLVFDFTVQQYLIGTSRIVKCHIQWLPLCIEWIINLSHLKNKIKTSVFCIAVLSRLYRKCLLWF